ncbi:MAG: LamG domain-containing protein [Nitrosotalea sp.]
MYKIDNASCFERYLLTVVFASLLLSLFTVSAQNVFAETSSNQTTHMEINGTSNATLTFDQFSNATTSDADNQTLTFDQFSNATTSDANNQTLTFDQFSNATTSDANNQTLTFDQFSNATEPEPEPTKLLSSNKTSLKLDGNGYIKGNDTYTKYLPSLTISSWVKPDYNQGSPQFTVISEENSFILGINNNLPPVKKAVFSVFDGIKWNTITSTSDITESWTHVVGTFNGSSISLYVNGNEESSMRLSQIPTIVNGHIETITPDNLPSNSTVVVGTYYNSIRDEQINSFSGNIESVDLYDLPLSSIQISQIYSNGALTLGISPSSTNHTNTNVTANNIPEDLQSSSHLQAITLPKPIQSWQFNLASNQTSMKFNGIGYTIG